MTVPLLEVRDLTKSFRVRGAQGGAKVLRAVNSVSFDVGHQETVALVGESGCGKSTTGLATLRLIEPTSGAISFDGTDITTISGRRLRALRRRMQIVLQDPRAQLDARMTIKKTIREPLDAHNMGNRAERNQRVVQLLDLVGLSGEFIERYPHELSGGQRQRVAIARALAPKPDLIVCDEAVSALDVSVQTQVLNLLGELQEQLGVSYLFISHNMTAVRYIADQVVVMYLGHVVESAPATKFFAAPAHPYSEALLSAVPSPIARHRRDQIVLSGDVPNPLDPPSGCIFRTRCPYAQDICATEFPREREVSPGHKVMCYFPRS